MGDGATPQRHLHIHFTATPFTTHAKLNKLGYSTDDWKKKMWNTHKMELFLIAKKNEIMIEEGGPAKHGTGRVRKGSERGIVTKHNSTYA